MALFSIILYSFSNACNTSYLSLLHSTYPNVILPEDNNSLRTTSSNTESQQTNSSQVLRPQPVHYYYYTPPPNIHIDNIILSVNDNSLTSILDILSNQRNNHSRTNYIPSQSDDNSYNQTNPQTMPYQQGYNNQQGYNQQRYNNNQPNAQ